MRFLRSIALPNTDLAASGSITPFDLPVNPLSMLLVRFQITNANPAAIGTYSAFDDIVTQITGLRVLHKGEQIIAGSLRDLMVLNAAAFGVYPGIATKVNTNAAVRSVVFPLCLGRRPFDPKSCFPATTRGNLRFELDAGADGSGYGDINMSVEAVELIEAEPEEYVKYTTSAGTSVIGQFDARLPIGNPLLGVLLFDTGLGASSDEVLSWGSLRLVKDNVEQYYSTVDFEVLAGELAGKIAGQVELTSGHIHQINDGAALSDSDDAERVLSQGFNGYGYLDFDPLKDGSYQLETQGAADLAIRATGDEATAIRWLPLERIAVKR